MKEDQKGQIFNPPAHGEWKRIDFADGRYDYNRGQKQRYMKAAWQAFALITAIIALSIVTMWVISILFFK